MYEYPEQAEILITRREYVLLVLLYQKVTQERMAGATLGADEVLRAFKETESVLGKLHGLYSVGTSSVCPPPQHGKRREFLN